MPRYCDACRTFITSRDSLTWNATPAPELTPNFPFDSHSLLSLRVCQSASRGSVMTFRNAYRQGILSGSCPINRVSTSVVSGSLGVFSGSHHLPLYPLLRTPLDLAVFCPAWPVLTDGYPLSSGRTLVLPLSFPPVRFWFVRIRTIICGDGDASRMSSSWATRKP